MNGELLIERAKLLPSAAKIAAVGAYVQFLEKHPAVEKVKPRDWDFFLTVAGIFVAASQLNHENISEQNRELALETITDTAAEVYQDIGDACGDCRNFVDRTYDGLAKTLAYKQDQRFLFSDSLGGWVVWNLFGHAPSSEDERKLTRAIGGFLVHAFFSWWVEGKDRVPIV